MVLVLIFASSQHLLFTWVVGRPLPPDPAAPPIQQAIFCRYEQDEIVCEVLPDDGAPDPRKVWKVKDLVGSWGENREMADMEHVQQALAVAPSVDMDKMEQKLADTLGDTLGRKIQVNQPIP